jgi:hypothetical protein
MYSSTAAKSRRDQTAVLYYPPFGSFFGSFLDKQERTYESCVSSVPKGNPEMKGFSCENPKSPEKQDTPFLSHLLILPLTLICCTRHRGFVP